MSLYAEQVQFGPLKEERVTYCHRPSHSRPHTDRHNQAVSAGQQTTTFQHISESSMGVKMATIQYNHDPISREPIAKHNNNCKPDVQEQRTTTQLSSGSTDVEHKAMAPNGVTNPLTPQGANFDHELRCTVTTPLSPSSLSPESWMWKSSPPYTSPIISATSSFPSFKQLSPSAIMNLAASKTSPTSSFPSFTPISPSAIMNLAASQTSSTSPFLALTPLSPSIMTNFAGSQTSPTSLRAFTPSSELSREMFSGGSSSLRFIPSKSSSPSKHSGSSSSASFENSPRTSSETSPTPQMPSPESLQEMTSPGLSQEMTSPGLSSSRDSGFSSPSPAEGSIETVTENDCKAKNGQKISSKRTNFTARQTATLQRMFEENPYPNCDVMENVAVELQMSQRQVKIWFQNRRARHRRRKTSSTRETQYGMTPTQRIYSPMTPAGYHTPVTMPMTSPCNLQSAIPVYMPTTQGQTSPETSFQPELLRHRRISSCPQSLKPYGQTTGVYRHVIPINNPYSIHNSWPGVYHC